LFWSYAHLGLLPAYRYPHTVCLRGSPRRNEGTIACDVIWTSFSLQPSVLRGTSHRCHPDVFLEPHLEVKNVRLVITQDDSRLATSKPLSITVPSCQGRQSHRDDIILYPTGRGNFSVESTDTHDHKAGNENNNLELCDFFSSSPSLVMTKNLEYADIFLEKSSGPRACR
jgi:hypothetical protein